MSFLIENILKDDKKRNDEILRRALGEQRHYFERAQYQEYRLHYFRRFSHYLLHRRQLNIPMLQITKRKGGQIRFSSLQTEALEKRFNLHKYLSPEERKILAHSLKLSDRQVKTWFQNRRAKWRKVVAAAFANNNKSNVKEEKAVVDNVNKK